jgi:hypothetical protein
MGGDSTQRKKKEAPGFLYVSTIALHVESLCWPKNNEIKIKIKNMKYF